MENKKVEIKIKLKVSKDEIFAFKKETARINIDNVEINSIESLNKNLDSKNVFWFSLKNIDPLKKYSKVFLEIDGIKKRIKIPSFQVNPQGTNEKAIVEKNKFKEEKIIFLKNKEENSIFNVNKIMMNDMDKTKLEEEKRIAKEKEAIKKAKLKEEKRIAKEKEAVKKAKLKEEERIAKEVNENDNSNKHKKGSSITIEESLVDNENVDGFEKILMLISKKTYLKIYDKGHDKGFNSREEEISNLKESNNLERKRMLDDMKRKQKDIEKKILMDKEIAFKEIEEIKKSSEEKRLKAQKEIEEIKELSIKEKNKLDEQLKMEKNKLDQQLKTQKEVAEEKIRISKLEGEKILAEQKEHLDNELNKANKIVKENDLKHKKIENELSLKIENLESQQEENFGKLKEKEEHLLELDRTIEQKNNEIQSLEQNLLNFKNQVDEQKIIVKKREEKLKQIEEIVEN